MRKLFLIPGLTKEKRDRIEKLLVPILAPIPDLPPGIDGWEMEKQIRTARAKEILSGKK